MARAFRQWDHRYGDGLRRKAVLGRLAEVAGVLEDRHAEAAQGRLAGFQRATVRAGRSTLPHEGR
ncbi:hypothetical protein ACF08M_28575 [Streptomyces sp. NPDC015032]|uniref:hypothetical protein n=1 Tax=Streptomyces sp. NPDC015032 TaxID=3364937 RepID=UPI0036F5502C